MITTTFTTTSCGRQNLHPSCIFHPSTLVGFRTGVPIPFLTTCTFALCMAYSSCTVFMSCTQRLDPPAYMVEGSISEQKPEPPQVRDHLHLPTRWSCFRYKLLHCSAPPFQEFFCLSQPPSSLFLTATTLCSTGLTSSTLPGPPGLSSAAFFRLSLAAKASSLSPRVENEPRTPPQGALNGCSFSPDGLRAMTSSRDGTVKLWEFDEGVLEMGGRGWLVGRVLGGGGGSDFRRNRFDFDVTKEGIFAGLMEDQES